MIKYKNNINVGTGSVGYEADATSAAPQDSVSEGRIVKSEGRTVKWNQIIPISPTSMSTTENGITMTDNRDGSFTFSGTASADTTLTLTENWTNVQNDIYYFTSGVDNPQSGVIVKEASSGVAIDGGRIIKLTVLSSRRSFRIVIPNGTTLNDYKCSPIAIDLTAIFGSGNEPATVKAFEEWLSENMVEQDYYADDAGSLVPVTVKGVKRNVGGTTVTNPMPVTTLKDENDVVMFPDGLKSAGSAKDEIDWEHGVAVKRVGVVDLGDLTWSFDNSSYFKGVLTDRRYDSHVVNVLCSKYKSASDTSVGSMNDKEVGTSATSSNIFVMDSDYTDAAAFKTAVTGQKLYYELATPITYHFATHTELKKRVVKIGESVEVDGIEGETVIWNQLVENGDFSDGTTGWNTINNATLSYANNILTVSCPASTLFQGIRKLGVFTNVGHKYYIHVNVASSDIQSVRIYSGSGGSYGISKVYNVGSISDIVTLNTSANDYLNITKDSYTEACEFTVDNIMVTDLTLMFGSGNEPSTVAEFESWLSAHGGIKDYYPYCAGELKDKEEGNVRGVTQNPYKSITRSVDLTTLKGKVNGAGEDVVMFPDGMKQAGSVKDEIFVEGGVVKAVKRVGTVDLGDLEYSREFHLESFYRFRTTNFAKQYGSGLCASLDAGSIDNLNDKQFGIGRTVFAIRYDDYTDASDFTTAMQGVMLNYELASPVTYVVNMQGMEMAEVKKVIVGTQKVWEKS